MPCVYVCVRTRVRVCVCVCVCHPGENTISSMVGQGQLAKTMVGERGANWAGQLARSSTAKPDEYAVKAVRHAFDYDTVDAAKELLRDFSKEHDDHGVQFVAGDATTGEQGDGTGGQDRRGAAAGRHGLAVRTRARDRPQTSCRQRHQQQWQQQ